MHPEIVAHGPGRCPKCGMDLEPRDPEERKSKPARFADSTCPRFLRHARDEGRKSHTLTPPAKESSLPSGYLTGGFNACRDHRSIGPDLRRPGGPHASGDPRPARGGGGLGG